MSSSAPVPSRHSSRVAGNGALQRACDRCAELKTQCSGHSPCDRCRRIGVSCTRDRPVLARGRPRKSRSKNAARQQHRELSADSTTCTLTPAASLLSTLENLPLEGLPGVEMLDGIFDVIPSVGILNAFRRNHHWLLVADHSSLPEAERTLELSFLRSRAILSTLFACAVAFNPAAAAVEETFSENCRIYALSDIPILTWKNRAINRSDIYCLYLLSNLGFLQIAVTEMAARWAVLSEALSLTDSPSTSTSIEGPGLSELDRRICGLVDINSEVQRLLFNRPYRQDELGSHVPDFLDQRPSFELQPLRRPTIPDSDWHQLLMQSAESPNYQSPEPDQGLFDLFLPLSMHLKFAFSFPKWKDVGRGLEDYFISFPTALMELDKVSLPWQLEAMIWFHGIYLLLTCGPDFLRILLFPDIAGTAFHHAAEHAILLGDILPYLSRMDSAVLRLSHATIYFIALSAAVHASMIQYIFTEPSSLPPILLQSAQSHSNILNTIIEANRTCDHPVIKSVAGILSDLLVAKSTAELNVHSHPVQDLKYYRWVPGGRGLIQLNESAAQNLLLRDCASRAAEDSTATISTISTISPELQYILDPGSRIN